MSNNLLPEGFDIVTGLEEGGIVGRTLNTDSPSNQSLLEDFQTIDDILTIPYSTNSCFDLNNLPKTTEMSTLLSHLCELMIRFDSAPNKYQKADYEHFIKTITNALIYLYTRDQSISDVENVIHFMGIATLDTNPEQERILNGHKYPGMYLANTVGVYTNFGIEVTTLADSIIYFFPKIVNGLFTGYEKFTYNIDGSKWELVDGLLRTKEGAKITLQDINEKNEIVIHKTGTLPDPELYKSGDTWLNEETLDLYTLYDDGVTKTWINTGSKNITETLHSSTVDKNAEPEFQHVTQEEKDLIASTATVVNGHTEDISNLETNKADKATTLSGYGITDAYTKTEIDTNFENHKTYSIVTYDDLLALIGNNELIPNSSYRITNYTTTTVQTNTTSAGHDFDVIVTALSTNELSEIASCVRKEGDTYFTNAKLEAWEIKYCINNDTSRFAWADTVNGKGVIYYMKDEWNNECPYDFKNIQFKKSDVFLYTFGGATDDSLTGGCHHNRMRAYVSGSRAELNFNTFGTGCYSNTFDNNCRKNTFGNTCYSNTFDNFCGLNTFGNYFANNIFGNTSSSNTAGNYFINNIVGNYCMFNTFYTGTSGTTKKNYLKYIVLEDGCRNNNFYSSITTSNTNYLQRIRIKGLEFTSATNTQISLSATNTKYEWLICYTSSGVLKQYCPEDNLTNNLLPLIYAGL